MYLYCFCDDSGKYSYLAKYSQRIEKLTRRRAIPVIATIFLLPYNKILLVTNTALFYYL